RSQLARCASRGSVRVLSSDMATARWSSSGSVLRSGDPSHPARPGPGDQGPGRTTKSEEPPGPVAGGAAVPAGGPGRGGTPGARRTEAAPAETLTGDAAQAGEEARPVPGYEVSSPRRSLPACWGSNQASSQATKRTLSKSRRARFFRLP